MAITYSTGDYYTTSSASGTYYTTSTPSQQWYYYDADGNIIRSVEPPHQHSHEIPSHSHGSWGIQQPSEQIIEYQGDDVKFNLSDGRKISMKELVSQVDTLDKMMTMMYNILSPWQKDMIMRELKDKKKEEDFEHLDPDLFKV